MATRLRQLEAAANLQRALHAAAFTLIQMQLCKAVHLRGTIGACYMS